MRLGFCSENIDLAFWRTLLGVSKLVKFYDMVFEAWWSSSTVLDTSQLFGKVNPLLKVPSRLFWIFTTII